MVAPTKDTGRPHHPHDQSGDHPHQHGEQCDDNHKRCYTHMSGYVDCPDTDSCHFVTKMLTVACAADNPLSQIGAYLALAGNFYDEVIQVIDLGHNGWLVIFRHPV